MLCEYGCGNEAKYQFKNGVWCCSKHSNSCPAIKRKNSIKRKEQCLSEDFLKNNPLKKYHNDIKKGIRNQWNKGLTKETSDKVKKYAETLKRKYAKKEIIPVWLGKHLPQYMKEKISKNGGGYRKGSGRGKKGYYKGIYCDSTYELAYLIYCLDHNIDIKRCNEVFEYEYDGKIHKYYPDFVVNGEIIEIKGEYLPIVDIKMNAITKPSRILYYDDLKPMFDYVAEAYGKRYDKSGNNFYELYD